MSIFAILKEVKALVPLLSAELLRPEDLPSVRDEVVAKLRQVIAEVHEARAKGVDRDQARVYHLEGYLIRVLNAVVRDAKLEEIEQLLKEAERLGKLEQPPR